MLIILIDHQLHKMVDTISSLSEQLSEFWVLNPVISNPLASELLISLFSSSLPSAPRAVKSPDDAIVNDDRTYPPNRSKAPTTKISPNPDICLNIDPSQLPNVKIS